MAWHKQKQYDPTEAFLANNKQQQLLELRIKDIDKLWFARLKYYAKDRLETTAELMRLTDDKRHLDHFNKSLNPEELRLYTHHIGHVMKVTHKELTSDNFDFDKYKRRLSYTAVQPRGGATSLPRIEKQNTNVNFRLKRREPMINKTDLKQSQESKKSSSRRSSNTGRVPSSLQSSRFISMSDTDLYKKRKDRRSSIKNTPLKRAASDLEQRLKTDLYKKSKDFKNSKLDLESILRVADVNSPELAGKKSAKNNRKLPLLAPKKLVVTKDDHRYLKHRMETNILPPLSEDTPKRKLSC